MSRLYFSLEGPNSFARMRLITKNLAFNHPNEIAPRNPNLFEG